MSFKRSIGIAVEHHESRSTSRTEPAGGCTCSAGEGDNELRCLCGSLLARHVEGGIELRCRRCKRSVIVPAPAGAEV